MSFFKNIKFLYLFAIVGAIERVFQQNESISMRLSGLENNLQNGPTEPRAQLRDDRFIVLPDFPIQTLKQLCDFDESLSATKTLQELFVSEKFSSCQNLFFIYFFIYFTARSLQYGR